MSFLTSNLQLFQKESGSAIHPHSLMTLTHLASLKPKHPAL